MVLGRPFLYRVWIMTDVSLCVCVCVRRFCGGATHSARVVAHLRHLVGSPRAKPVQSACIVRVVARLTSPGGEPVGLHSLW